MLIRLLGPVDVVDDDGNVHGSTSAIRRTLLALFAIHAGRVLSADWLLEHVLEWRSPRVRAPRSSLPHLAASTRARSDSTSSRHAPAGTAFGWRRERWTACSRRVTRARGASEETDDGRAARLCAEGIGHRGAGSRSSTRRPRPISPTRRRAWTSCVSP